MYVVICEDMSRNGKFIPVKAFGFFNSDEEALRYATNLDVIEEYQNIFVIKVDKP